MTDDSDFSRRLIPLPPPDHCKWPPTPMSAPWGNFLPAEDGEHNFRPVLPAPVEPMPIHDFGSNPTNPFTNFRLLHPTAWPIPYKKQSISQSLNPSTSYTSTPATSSFSSVPTEPTSPLSAAQLSEAADDFIQPEFSPPLASASGKRVTKQEKAIHDRSVPLFNAGVSKTLSTTSFDNTSHRRRRGSKDRRFQCFSCDSWFTRKFDMEKHALSIHEQVRSYGCDLCQRRFYQRHHMERHKKSVHHGERPWACEVCPLTFSRKEHRNNHCRAKHAGQERGSCPKCGSLKAFEEGMQMHLQTLHNVTPEKAEELSLWQKLTLQPRSRKAAMAKIE